MAWIKVDVNMPEHRKTKRFARLIGVDVPHACGFLTLFWIWALKYAGENGEIKGDEEDLADGVGWTGDAALFTHALRDAGFIDEGNIVHAWDEYEGAYRCKTEKDRTRQAKNRAKKNADADVTQSSRVTPRLEQNRQEENREDQKRQQQLHPEETALQIRAITLLSDHGIEGGRENALTLTELLRVYGEADTTRAIEEAKRNPSVHNPLKYVAGILSNWQNGKGAPPTPAQTQNQRARNVRRDYEQRTYTKEQDDALFTNMFPEDSPSAPAEPC